jgi:predicted metal-dependent phosphoesterase TrpH
MMPNSDSDTRSFIYDFHCHSRASDGDLSPAELVALAAKQQVEWLALTDHDTHAGLEEAATACREQGVRLCPGAEWSLLHEAREYHVLGLNVDPTAPVLCQLENRQQAARCKRAQAIGQRLDRAAKTEASYTKACDMAGSDAPGRPWFAKVLLAEGRVRDMQHAFNRFLKKGQAAFVATPWASFEEGIDIIRQAGGTAVLAHPQHYNLTRIKLRRLLADFREAGGQGMEVAMPGLTPQQARLLVESCADFELAASGGSDFHSPEQHWLTLGKLPPIPAELPSVWSLWQ